MNDEMAATPPLPAISEPDATEIARSYLDLHTLGFGLANDERQEIARIMASFSAARTAHREILSPAISGQVEQLRDSRNPMIAMAASLAAAISLLEKGGKKAAPSDRMFEQMLDDYRRTLDNGRAALTNPPA